MYQSPFCTKPPIYWPVSNPLDNSHSKYKVERDIAFPTEKDQPSVDTDSNKLKYNCSKYNHLKITVHAHTQTSFIFSYRF